MNNGCATMKDAIGQTVSIGDLIDLYVYDWDEDLVESQNYFKSKTVKEIRLGCAAINHHYGTATDWPSWCIVRVPEPLVAHHE
jgi:hypothetical protein